MCVHSCRCACRQYVVLFWRGWRCTGRSAGRHYTAAGAQMLRMQCELQTPTESYKLLCCHASPQVSALWRWPSSGWLQSGTRQGLGDISKLGQRIWLQTYILQLCMLIGPSTYCRPWLSWQPSPGLFAVPSPSFVHCRRPVSTYTLRFTEGHDVPGTIHSEHCIFRQCQAVRR